VNPKRTAIVTGGSRGIGRAIVEVLVRDGWTVAFTWRSDEASARAVEVAVPDARAFRLDARDRPRAAALVAEVESGLGPVAALVNNAGIQRDTLLALTSDEQWDEILDVNVGGVFRCCRAVLPGMISRRAGAIVNVASLSAVRGRPGQAAYAASKAAVVGLTRALSREVGKRGVRVNAVLPGFVATEMTGSLPPELVSELRAMESLKAGTGVGAVAEAVAFLVSERAASVTGQALVVDSGASA
jgi:3-oxoacyl-[acyl-carrier protein] reductase